ncbi:MAG: O-methyltransferase, partial [candidate division Zixibacteria bacterium]|nr:O-methyltransferase [candidate division Zixibacteria bacterium]
IWTKAIQEYNRKCYASDTLWTTIIPLRDGVAVSVKL